MTFGIRVRVVVCKCEINIMSCFGRLRVVCCFICGAIYSLLMSDTIRWISVERMHVRCPGIMYYREYYNQPSQLLTYFTPPMACSWSSFNVDPLIVSLNKRKSVNWVKIEILFREINPSGIQEYKKGVYFTYNEILLPGLCLFTTKPIYEISYLNASNSYST